jgi:Putative auto-transporter adhesin, head GIN domain
MKFIIYLTKIVVAGIIALLFGSCQFNSIKGSGNVTTENRMVKGEFTKIQANKGLDIVLEQTNTIAVIVEADDNLQKHITTKVENGVLIITSDYNGYINVKSKKVIVQAPKINGIEVSSGANFTSKNTLKIPSISVESSSGSDIKLAVETEKLTCEASSGSHITIHGKAIEFETVASSGSGIEAENLLSNDIVASASSGGSVDVNPILSLNAEASSGGNINYHSIPKTITKKSSSGGNINKE